MSAYDEVGKSKLLEEAGNARHCVSDIDRLIKASLTEAGLVWNRDRTLVIVSHMPFVNTARGECEIEDVDVTFGEVIELDIGAWTPSEKTSRNGFTEKVDEWIETIENGGTPWQQPKKDHHFWE